ncbi:alpha/beta hydrolase [Alkalinema pantanalense CENA528]|uniref:alpha/beta hydrolase n=1 Tax=Alkalinema pantanalense TaxID=1620705 RepID=UPI003D6F71DA
MIGQQKPIVPLPVVARDRNLPGRVQRNQLQGWGRILALVCGCPIGFSLLWAGSFPAQAAETAIVKYSILRESIPVQDLSEFGKTGTQSPALAAHLKLAKRDPAQVRQSLTDTVKLDKKLADRVLNSPIGDRLLDELSTAIYNPAGVADRQALRAALTLSVQDDGKLSVLEVLEKYPTKEVLIDGDRISEVYQRLRKLEKQLKNPLSLLKLG